MDARPTERAMKLAVTMEVHAALSTVTISKAAEIDKAFPGYDKLVEALAESLEIARRNEDGPFVDQAEAALKLARQS